MPPAEAAVLLNISEMIDLAIGSPEVGVVDFNMLQTVLHCLAQQLRVLDKSVELRGSAAMMPSGGALSDNAQTITINEFVLDTDGKAELADATQPTAGLKKGELQVPPLSTEPDTILVVERVKRVESPRSLARSAGGGRDDDQGQADVAPVSRPSTVAPRLSVAAPAVLGSGSKEKLSLVTLSKFNLLESAVEDLKDRVYGSMPKNEDILEEVRSQTNLKAITDMWTSLNVSSRLEAAEAGIGKLSSLVQDLISEIGAGGKGESQMKTEEGEEDNACPIGREEQLRIIAELERLRIDVDALRKHFKSVVQEVPSDIVQEEAAAEMALTEAAAAEEPADSLAPPAAAIPRKSIKPRLSIEAATQPLMERLNDLEKKMAKCCENIGKTEGMVQDQLNSFQDQIEGLMRQIASLTNDLSAGKLSPDLIKDLQGLLQLFQTVQEMQEQLKQVHETALMLAAEKEDRQHHINVLLEQIELLKTIKLDREDMEDAMAEKADLRMLARKVSHDQFEVACDDLSRGLEHALGKLNVQEALWQQALDDIQREIETKLDKMELSPVKDFFNGKLRQLQDHLKQMALLRQETEAAGTKRRLLRDVNCISCDAKAVMPMEAQGGSQSKPMPATLSMKPYLSYELDTIRKQQASNVPQRNMHDWEAIDKQMAQTQPKQPLKARSEVDKHLCNRYCGGSHTVTTPAQRVARTGHFIKQWGPDVVPLSSGFAAGDDGRLYKVSTNEAANVGPGGAVDPTCTKPPAPAHRKSDTPKPSRQLDTKPVCPLCYSDLDLGMPLLGSRLSS